MTPFRPPVFRLALFLGTALCLPAWAQLPPTPTPPTQAPDADPPSRVGRLARLKGSVSFHPPGAAEWVPASRNFPLIQGDALWTEARASAAIELGGARVTMAGQTEIGFDQFAAGAVTTTIGQGELCLQVDPTPAPQTYVLRTPRGTVTVTQPGRYGVLAGDTAEPTVVTVLAGAAQLSLPNDHVQLTAGQAASVAGTGPFEGKTGPARADIFLRAACAPPRAIAPPPPAAALMVGADRLAAFGAWQTTSDYGEVWFPRVAANWAPYHDGHWAWVAPWGWTWIDDAPWGFAPFHYGRWAEIGGRWGWVPVGRPVANPPPPVYAPALVAFIGLGAAAGGSVAWLPLGPREPYHPWYHASPGYVQNVNARQVDRVDENVTIDSFANRGAAIAAPAAALAASRPVRLVAQPLPAARLATAEPIRGRDPLPPAGAAQGVMQPSHPQDQAARGVAEPAPTVNPVERSREPRDGGTVVGGRGLAVGQPGPARAEFRPAGPVPRAAPVTPPRPPAAIQPPRPPVAPVAARPASPRPEPHRDAPPPRHEGEHRP